MILRKPVTQVRRKQERLLTITRQEVLSHTRILERKPDRTPCSRPPFCATASRGSESRPGHRRSVRRAGTGVFVLVVSLNPEHRVWCTRVPLVAPIRRPVEDGVVAHQEL